MPSKHKPTKVLKEQRARTARLWRELKRAPKGELLGVVDASGAWGSQSQGDKRWTLTLPLVAWRWQNGIVQHSRLTVCRQVGERTVGRMVDTVKGLEVVRMRARLALDNSIGAPHAMLFAFHGRAKDRELGECAATLRKPVVVRDKRFGLLRLNRSSGMFEGAAKWNGRRVRLELETTQDGSAQAALQHAARLWSAQARWQRLVRRRLVNESYRAWLKVWRLEDHSRLSDEQFLRRLRLRGIRLSANGGVDFVFADGDLFGGHDVVIFGKVGRGVSGSDLVG